MSMLQITLGAAGGTNWPEVFALGLAPLSVLASALLTNRSLAKHKKADDEARRKERETAETLRLADEELRRGFAALGVAEHLETYVLRCNEVIASWGIVEWVSPMEHDSPAGHGPVYLKPLPDWPAGLEWQLLGVAAKVEASNFKRRTELIHLRLADMAPYSDNQDQLRDNADRAADLAISAWETAKAMRATHGLAPLLHPDGWDFSETAREHIELRQTTEGLRRVYGRLGATGE